MSHHTLYADALAPGDHIIGDRVYPSGLLDFTVTEVSKTTLAKGTLVTVKVVSHIATPYAVNRTITYDGQDSVIVASIPVSDPFDGITDVKTNDAWDAS